MSTSNPNIVGSAYIIADMKSIPPFVSPSFDAFEDVPHTSA